MDLTPSYPPYRMKLKQAAYYAGMSISSFQRAIDEGDMPRGQKGIGGTFWLRIDLEAAMNGVETLQHDFGQRI